jgi:hypothetical protein
LTQICPSASIALCQSRTGRMKKGLRARIGGQSNEDGG